MPTIVMLRAASFLARASDEALTRLAAQSRLCEFEAGSYLFRIGEPAERISLIRHGQVAATVDSREGARLIFHIAEAGECAGFASMVHPSGNHLLSAHALSRVEAVALPSAACIELMSAEPAVALDLARDLSQIIGTIDQSMADLVFFDLERRLAQTLVNAPSRDEVVSLPVSQGELAARLGCARQTLNQALGRLARRGFILIESPRSIRITDRDALKALVGGVTLSGDPRSGRRT